ncbi:MAG: DoxX family membrane protein [Phycisphaeraceae bacterium]|nr:DoxX family membrane protein [Phycisphaeraceae bacterium]
MAEARTRTMSRFSLLLRWLIGLLFILAGGSKLLDPASFKLQIEVYRLITGAAASVVATYLPWLELTAGVTLLIPRWSRAAASILLGLMVVFSIALTAAWLRGINLKCGCFDLELDWPFWGLILRDAVLTCGIITIMWVHNRGCGPATIEAR